MPPQLVFLNGIYVSLPLGYEPCSVVREGFGNKHGVAAQYEPLLCGYIPHVVKNGCGILNPCVTIRLDPHRVLKLEIFKLHGGREIKFRL